MRGARRGASLAVFMPVWLLITLMTAACTVNPAKSPNISDGTMSSVIGDKIVFVISNGFHSSVMVSRADIMPNRIPESEDFPLARYLEFGWGDSEYYPAQNVTFAMTLRAAFLPSPAVLHMAATSLEPSRRYPEAEVIPLFLDEAGMQSLVNFIDASFQRAGQSRAKAVQPGLYADSFFYPAVGRFHIGNTCNTWTTRALMSAGFPVEQGNALDAESLMSQVRQLKEVAR
jgi:uncharacterized protein (TIGR02117 family)